MEVVAYVWDGEVYCPDCIGDEYRDLEETGAVFGYSDQDAPLHCGAWKCQRFIKTDLTRDGFEYLKELWFERGFRDRAMWEEYLAAWDRSFDFYWVHTFLGRMNPLFEIKWDDLDPDFEDASEFW
jgi:hypothetical protein